jgi:hypothetical protein
MTRTLRICGDLIEWTAGQNVNSDQVYRTFVAVQKRLMEVTRPRELGDLERSALSWLGDKKPVQHADPHMQQFISKHFHKPKFIHLIRHPRIVVASMAAAGRSWGRVQHWRGVASAILERWVAHEKWVISAKARGANIFTMRFEDLGAHPLCQVSQLFSFLGLNVPSEVAKAIISDTSADMNAKYEGFKLELSAEAKTIMDLYQYK